MTSRKRLVILCLALASSMAAALADGDYAWTKATDKLKLAASDSAKYTVEGSHAELSYGAALLMPAEAMDVRTPNADVRIKPRSLVFMRSITDSDHIFCLLGGASVHVDRHGSSLSSGDEATVTKHEPTTKDLAGDEIGRRRRRVNKLANGYTMTLHEFSLLHCIEREPIIYSLVHSNTTDGKAVKERLIKMATVLTYVTGRHGNYSTSP